MRVALYARVSSERQDVDLSISAQLKALREYAYRNGHTVVREYLDEAESGRTIDRPGFREMIIAARRKPALFEAVLVWKLSRFARNREDSIIYKSLLRRHGTHVLSINEPVEDTPSGRLLEGIIEVIDEFYSANLSQDVVRGMKENAARGFRNGGTAPYGYKRISVQDGSTARAKLEPDPKAAPIVQRIFREAIAGKGLVAIAHGLNDDGVVSMKGQKWGSTSIEKILHNEAYTGTLVWGKHGKQGGKGEEPVLLRTERAWPAIIDRSSFRTARAMLATRTPKVIHPREVSSPYLLSGLMRCGKCGATMIGEGSGRHYRYYVCGSARRKGRAACPSPTLPKDKMESYIIERIRNFVLVDENLKELVRLTNDELAQTRDSVEQRLILLEAQIAEVDNRLGKLYDVLETGEFKSGELSPRIQSLIKRKDELQRAKCEAEETVKYNISQITDSLAVRDYANDLGNSLARSSIAEQKNLLKSFIEKIEVNNSEAKMYYALPVPPNALSEETIGLLPFIHHGKGQGMGASCKARLFS